MAGKNGPVENASADRWLTLPNLITGLRIIGSPGLVILAVMGEPFWLGVFAVVLVLTEWLDGYLARLLHAESASGARLDTVADAVFYSCLLVAVILLNPGMLASEIYWIIAAILSYWLSWLASWVKFRRLPSYHTWSAKATWVVMGVGIVSLLFGWGAWPFRMAMVCVVITNLEAVAITRVLDECQVNVPSVWHALQVVARQSKT